MIVNIRWLWLDHVPPEMNLSLEDRAEVLRLAREKRRTDPRFRRAHVRSARSILMVCVPMALSFTLWIFVLVQLRPGTLWFVLSNTGSILLFNVLLWVCIAWGIYRTNAPFVRWALSKVGKPVCINCGYILTGAADATRPCPECGEAPEEVPGFAAEKSPS